METQKQSTSFDFEHWANLATTDPERFEESRSAAIEAAIKRAPERTQVRLRRLQWQLDQVRKVSDNPLAACVKMNKMMWERFAGEGGLIDTLQLLKDGETPDKPPVRDSADVLPFRRAQAR